MIYQFFAIKTIQKFMKLSQFPKSESENLKPSGIFPSQTVVERCNSPGIITLS
jgi:hypothetical protein